MNLNLLNILSVEGKGLETELLLEADLQNLVDLLKRVVDVLERGVGALENGEDSISDIIEALGRAIRTARGGSYSGANSAVIATDSDGSPVKQALEAAKQALESYEDRSSSEGEQSTRYEVDQNGDITKLTLNEAGEVIQEEIVGNVSELSEESE